MPLTPHQVHLDMRIQLDGTYHVGLDRTTFTTPIPFYGTRVVRLLTGTMGTLSALSGTITNISVANPTVVTSVGHGLATGQTVTISGSNSTPTINGSRVVTRINADTFSVPVNVTVLGTTGSFVVTDKTGFKVTGNYTHVSSGGAILGTLFDMAVELSEVFVRDEQDRPEIHPGAVIKRLTLMHRNKTAYGIQIDDANASIRASQTRTYSASLITDPETTYGRFSIGVGRIAERCTISIVETTYKPVQIAGLEYEIEIQEGLR